VDRVAASGAVTDGSKYSTAKNPSTRLYYKLHILNEKPNKLKIFGRTFCCPVNDIWFICSQTHVII
jgi:hypothetical protein